jgi:hypothetical protein
MTIPDRGANLDGIDTTRLIKNLQFRLGNVDEGLGDAGRLVALKIQSLFKEMLFISEFKITLIYSSEFT